MPNNHLQFQLQELNPPVPPQAAVLAETLALDPVPLAVRRQRVANGSKRKRDLAALQMADELDLLARRRERTEADQDVWARVAQRLREAVAPSTYALWLEPLELAGTDGESLLLTCPPDVLAWVHQRYEHLIVEALQAVGSTFTGVRWVAGGER